MYSNSKIHRFIALFMAILIFTTSIGFAIDVHLCNGQLKSISLIGKAKTCHDDINKGCPNHSKSIESANKQIDKTWDCCNNKIVYFKLEQDKQTAPLTNTLFKPIQDFANIHLPILTSLLPSKENKFSLPVYKPPSIEKIIFILIQSFRL